MFKEEKKWAKRKGENGVVGERDNKKQQLDGKSRAKSYNAWTAICNFANPPPSLDNKLIIMIRVRGAHEREKKFRGEIFSRKSFLCNDEKWKFFSWYFTLTIFQEIRNEPDDWWYQIVFMYHDVLYCSTIEH